MNRIAKKLSKYLTVFERDRPFCRCLYIKRKEQHTERINNLAAVFFIVIESRHLS